MHANEVTSRFGSLSTQKSLDEYNFEHFTTLVLLEDAKRTIRSDGICAGEIAPDFELEKVGGGAVRLSDLRGKPVLLHFGSYT